MTKQAILIPLIVWSIAIGALYGGGQLLKSAGVSRPYTVAGLTVSALWAVGYRSILGMDNKADDA